MKFLRIRLEIDQTKLMREMPCSSKFKWGGGGNSPGFYEILLIRHGINQNKSVRCPEVQNSFPKRKQQQTNLWEIPLYVMKYLLIRHRIDQTESLRCPVVKSHFPRRKQQQTNMWENSPICHEILTHQTRNKPD